MKPLEAWANISRRLMTVMNVREAMGLKPYSPEELEAEAICFAALKWMEERNGNNKTAEG